MKIPSIRSIQAQLIVYFTIAILVPAGITTMVGMKLIYDQIIIRAETKTISDINSGREIYRNRIAQIEGITRLTAARSLIVSALARGDRAFLQRALGKTREVEKLDILTLVDMQGIVVCRSSGAGVYGDTISADPFIARVLLTKATVSGTDIVPRERLEKESPALAAQAAMAVIPTPKAKHRENVVETAGMMLKAAVPLFDATGHFLGVLTGGILLNRNFELVDKINEIVHEHEVYRGRDIGTATIFQGDLRISTNVKNEDGSRAISTLVSEEVADAVLTRGERWLGDAFVVNDWFITAYTPIFGIDQRIIGMLYVGILKQPFTEILWRTVLLFFGIALGGILLVIAVSVQQARRISRPLKTLEGVARLIADGDYTREVTVKAPEEIEHLAGSINQMARKLAEEKKDLEEWAATLERKVKERTDQIKNIDAQLFRSEKLASLGKLAAGVAHEINNPLTGILTNSSLLLEDLPPGDSRREDVDVIVKETIRCREIVKRLLDFAKQTKPQKRSTNVNELIDKIILLVRNQALFRNIDIQRHLAPELPDILADPDQMQQVFINIILNAADAMAKGGKLVIRSSLATSGDALVVSFTDTGPGIAEENRERIFDPFFTTKEHGTGLGLSISYGIVEQHGGTIAVDSTVGQGSTFTVELPVMSADGGGS
jgi:two-component system, NtrC family, sensor kinase